MRIPRIYTPQALLDNTSVTLEAGASQHLARALRLQVGDELTLFDGGDGEFPAVITRVERKQVVVETGTRRDNSVESPLAIHLGIALSRGERMDWVVQKATELGVNAVTPLFTARSEVKLAGERAEKKIRHWQQIAISACEQCGRNRLPVIRPLARLDDWLDNTVAQRKLVLHHRGPAVQHAVGQPDSVALLIGPEGGLSPEEIRDAEKAGYSALRLGPRVLRTETAPLAAIAILQAQWGDMRPAG